MNGDIFLYNTLTRNKDRVPRNDDTVGMYTCGPTVYDRVHIGNLRTMIVSDLIRRTLEFFSLNVIQVINITDVGHIGDNEEDKMMRAIRRHNLEPTVENMLKVGEIYTNLFIEDLRKVNVKLPTHMPKASEHVREMIEMIDILIHKGYAYRTSDGIYFEVSKYNDYGLLGNLKGASDEISRIHTSSEKKDLRDFALWKFDETGWDSLFGKGFPGWHIECSAMSGKYLGDEFAIHTGGKDLAFIHHNNEIAQSYCATGKIPAKIWVHGEFININGEVMAKSSGNGVTMEHVNEWGFDGTDLRYWMLQAHYRSVANFSRDALVGARNSLKSLRAKIASWGAPSVADKDYMTRFSNFISDDLNMPGALTLVWECAKSDLELGVKVATLLKFDEVLGLDLSRSEDNTLSVEELPSEVVELLEERRKARENKSWELADELRCRLEDMGYEIVDTADLGQEVRKKDTE